MKLSFEALGVCLAWLLGWGGDMTIADDVTAAEYDKCIQTSNGRMFLDNAIWYDTNPNCRQINYNNRVILDATGLSKRHLGYWEDLLASGLLSESDATPIIGMIDNCHIIDEPDIKRCDFDPEKDSLSYALDATVKELDFCHKRACDYAARLGNITKSTTGSKIMSLINSSLVYRSNRRIRVLEEDVLKDYLKWLFYYNPFKPLDFTEDDIKKAVEVWKRLINEPSSYITNHCAEHQLRHFLYDVLKIKLLASSFLNLSNTEQDIYVNGTIPRANKGVMNAILQLNVIAIIKSMPTHEAAQKIYRDLEPITQLGWWYYEQFKATDLKYRLEEFLNSMSPQYRALEFPLEQIKQWAEDMRAVAAHFELTLNKTKRLQAEIKPYLAKNMTASSIHECVEYVASSSSISSPNPWWLPNSPIFHVAICSLFWARLTHLLELSS
ncbi:hypothetical protein NEHOM01_1004 [Nematocida homosporus]|uniref:uncharacterized protein n=1 Tax=Nematocida homosporus TaxID=1912981 RepID=UPI00221EEA8E|nr:uncharacterized protein NEHOM01_1004 [Nematocida homosporus]KAI5185712.1 hypothetical protein NEHOM01_1004 [Nematocida homosporus]